FWVPETWIVVQHHVQERIMNLQVSVVLDKSELAELVHEGAHPRPCSADHLRERLLAYLRYHGLRFALLAEIRHQEEQSRKTLLARIEELIYQVLLDASVPR